MPVGASVSLLRAGLTRRVLGTAGAGVCGQAAHRHREHGGTTRGRCRVADDVERLGGCPDSARPLGSAGGLAGLDGHRFRADRPGLQGDHDPGEHGRSGHPPVQQLMVRRVIHEPIDDLDGKPADEMSSSAWTGSSTGWTCRPGTRPGCAQSPPRVPRQEPGSRFVSRRLSIFDLGLGF